MVSQIYDTQSDMASRDYIFLTCFSQDKQDAGFSTPPKFQAENTKQESGKTWCNTQDETYGAFGENVAQKPHSEQKTTCISKESIFISLITRGYMDTTKKLPRMWLRNQFLTAQESRNDAVAFYYFRVYHVPNQII